MTTSRVRPILEVTRLLLSQAVVTSFLSSHATQAPTEMHIAGGSSKVKREDDSSSVLATLAAANDLTTYLDT